MQVTRGREDIASTHFDLVNRT